MRFTLTAPAREGQSIQYRRLGTEPEVMGHCSSRRPPQRSITLIEPMLCLSHVSSSRPTPSDNDTLPQNFGGQAASAKFGQHDIADVPAIGATNR